MKTRRILIPVFGFVAAAVLAIAGGWFALGNVANAQTSPAVPANVQVDQGTAIGQAVVSWDAVAGATGYTVRWVDLDAAWAAYDADGRWSHLIESEIVQASGNDRQSLSIPHLKTNTTRGHGFAVRTLRDGDASAWSDWEIVRLTAEVDFEAAVEILAAALALIREADALVAIASERTHIGMTRTSLRATEQQIDVHEQALDAQVGILEASGHGEQVGRISAQVNELVANSDRIQQAREALWKLLVAQATETVKLVTANQATLFPRSVESSDGEFGALMDADSVSEADRLRYSHLQSLAANVPSAHTLLLVAGRLQDPVVVARNQEAYESVAEIIRRDIEYLEGNRGLNLNPMVLPFARNLLAAGEDYFNRLDERLELTAVEDDRIAANAATLDRLVCEIDRLTDTVQGMSAESCPMPEPDDGTPGVNADTITFGQSAALTGPSAALGQGMKLGIEAAFKEANDAGVVAGRQLKLTTKDDGYESDRAFTATRQLIDDEQVFALIGAVGTPTSRAALPLAEEAEVPFVAPFTGAQLLRGEELAQVLNFRASYHQETAKMVDLLSQAGKTRVAVLYQNDSYGNDGLNGVKMAVDAQAGMELVGSWYYRRNTTAVNSAVFRIAAANPDAVIIIGGYQPADALIEKLRMKLEPDPTFLAVSFVGSNALANELGSDGEGVYVTQVAPLPSDTSSEVVNNYRNALTTYYPQETPGFISLEGYIAGRLAIERLKACGVNLTRECFLNVLGSATTVTIDDLTLQYGPGDNQGSDDVHLTVIDANGQLQPATSIASTP